MDQHKPFIWKSHWKAWVVLKVGWDETSGNNQSGVNSVSQVDVVAYVAPASWLCWERDQKRNDGLCQHFCLGESCPVVVSLNWTIQFLMPFNLLPCAGAQRE